MRYGRDTGSGWPGERGAFWRTSGRTSITFETVKRTVFQLVVTCSTLVALGNLSMPAAVYAAGVVRSSGSVAGVVQDAAGTPQIGAVVELLRADSSLAARAFTDRKGAYFIASVTPGKYALKAMGSSFIPTLKQNLRIRTNTVVNFTLNTLYDLMQWAPQAQRGRERNADDWAWTLRSSESRPLLRWLDDGSVIVVEDGSAETRRSGNRRRIRLVASGGTRQFGLSADRISAAMQQDVSGRRRVAMSADISPQTSGLMEAMLGFRQQMGSVLGGNSMQTLAAVMVDPSIAGASSPSESGQQTLEEAAFRTWENLRLLENLEAEAGSNQVMARLGDGGAVYAALPFASVTLHRGASALEYSVATAPTSTGAGDEGSEALPEIWLPVLSERDGDLVLEHGLHQEVGWSTEAGPADMLVVFYGDSIENPMIEGSVEGSARLAVGEEAGPWMMMDKASGMGRAAGPSYSATGMLAAVSSRLPGGNNLRLSYASGDALVLRAAAAPASVAAILQGAHAHRAQMYSLALSGTIEGLDTRWRASYRWQPDSTVTEVAPFAVNANEPYLNVCIRQPIHMSRQGTGGVEAQLDLRNLLAEGYQTFVTADGSRLIFAQAQRSIRGGLAFTF